MPSVMTKLTLMEDGTVAEPLNAILEVIYEHLSTGLQEEWARYITPCHREFSIQRYQDQKDLENKAGESRV